MFEDIGFEFVGILHLFVNLGYLDLVYCMLFIQLGPIVLIINLDIIFGFAYFYEFLLGFCFAWIDDFSGHGKNNMRAVGVVEEKHE